MNPSFLLYFNKRRQWATVHLWDVHPSTFAKWRFGRWGYFEAKWENPKSGFFGELHFVKSRLRVDTVVHELDHLRAEWIWANRLAWTGGKEESLVEMGDELLGRFLRELSKIEPKARRWFTPLGSL